MNPTATAKPATILGFVGRSNSGKTTVIDRIIPLLKSKGIRIGVVKHHKGDFEIDREGKDSYKHKKAGAVLSIIVSPIKLGLVRDVDHDMSIREILEHYVNVSEVDLVIAEGFKQEEIPKIEVFDSKKGEPPIALDDAGLIAIIADKQINASVPVFLRDDIEQIAEFIVTKFDIKHPDPGSGPM